MKTINIKTSAREELKDISAEVHSAIQESGVKNGICLIFTPHTTAAVTINENADPAVKADIISGIKSLALESLNYRHMEGNSPAHIKSSLFGCSESIIIENGKPVLGTWQGIYFCEFDGPRSRQVHIQTTGN